VGFRQHRCLFNRPSMEPGDAFVAKFPLGAFGVCHLPRWATWVGMCIVTSKSRAEGFHAGATVELVGTSDNHGSSPFEIRRTYDRCAIRTDGCSPGGVLLKRCQPRNSNPLVTKMHSSSEVSSIGWTTLKEYAPGGAPVRSNGTIDRTSFRYQRMASCQ